MKNRTGLVIGANQDAIHSIQAAQKNGIYIVAIDGNPKAEGFAYADESKVVDISNVNKIAKVVDAIKPDFILPIPIGRCLSTMGIINTRYGLKGPGEQAVTLSTDKYEFHQTLQAADLRNIDVFLVNENTQFSQIANISFPALFKPRYGSGSRDIFFANNEQKLKESYEKVIQKREDFVLEQMVEGTEYGVDGAVIDGNLFITLLREKRVTPLPMRQEIAYFSVINDIENADMINRVYKYIETAVKILGYNNCLLNADIIVNKDHVFLIEMAPRPSGHNLHNVFVPLATGIDMAEEYIHFLLGKDYHFSTNTIRGLQIRYFDMENVKVAEVPSENMLRNNPRCNLVMWNCNIHKGDRMNKVSDGHSIMNRGFFIVEGENQEDLTAQSEWILSQFQYEEVE